MMHQPSDQLKPAAAERAIILSAIGTPLTNEEDLHEEGLEAHLEDQWTSGIDGVLVAGTMGAMQLLRDDAYQALARRSVEMSAGRGEVLVGAGDCSLARTSQRIEFLNTLAVDGVVVLSPYFFCFSQAELRDYFWSLAEMSRAPLYLYDLPQRTRCKLELGTVLELAKHPNIRGIKCSDEPSYARELRDALGAGSSFRVIIAQAAMVDVLLRGGFREHVDGMFAIAPRWSSEIARRAEAQDWDGAAAWQRKLTALRSVVVQHGVLPAMTALLNARGIPGNFAPRPLKPLSAGEAREAMAANACVRELLEQPAARASAVAAAT